MMARDRTCLYAAVSRIWWHISDDKVDNMLKTDTEPAWLSEDVLQRLNRFCCPLV